MSVFLSPNRHAPANREKIAVHEPPANHKDRKTLMFQFMELLGIHRDRVVFIAKEVRVTYVCRDTVEGGPGDNAESIDASARM